jgi:hypothetical protein
MDHYLVICTLLNISINIDLKEHDSSIGASISFSVEGTLVDL